MSTGFSEPMERIALIAMEAEKQFPGTVTEMRPVGLYGRGPNTTHGIVCFILISANRIRFKKRIQNENLCVARRLTVPFVVCLTYCGRITHLDGAASLRIF